MSTDVAAVLLLPVAFVLAVFAGEGLIIMGDEAEETVPLGAALLADSRVADPCRPSVAAVVYGYRGYQAGRTAACPAGVDPGAAGVIALAVNLAAFISGWSSFR